MPTDFSTREFLKDVDADDVYVVVPDGVAIITDEPGKQGTRWIWNPGDQSGTLATGSITIQPTSEPGHIVNIDGHEFTLTDGSISPSPARPVTIGADAAATAENLRSAIAGLAADPTFPATATRSGAIVRLKAKKKGLSGNYIALSTIPRRPPISFKLSGPLLAGGLYSAAADRYMVETEISNNGTVATFSFDAEVRLAPSSAAGGGSGAWFYSPDVDATYAKPKITPYFFGRYISADPTHNRRVLQAAVETSSRFGWVVELDGDDPDNPLPGGEWIVDGLIRLTDDCDLRGEKGFTIVSISRQGAGFRAPVKLGGYASAFVANNDFASTLPDGPRWWQYVDWIDCTQADSTTLTVDPSIDHMLPVGSMLLIRDRSYYPTKGGQRPFVLMPNVRVDPATAGTGAIKLERPLDIPIAHAQVAFATCPVSLVGADDVIRPDLPGLVKGKVLKDHAGQRGYYEGGYMGVARGVRVRRVSLESRGQTVVTPQGPKVYTPGPVFAIGIAAYDCHLSLDSAIGRSVAFLNCFAYSDLHIAEAEAWEKIAEIALGGGESTITIDRATAVPPPVVPDDDDDDNEDEDDTEQDVGSIVQLGENVNGTTVTIDRLIVQQDYEDSAAVAVIRSASNCTLDIVNLKLPEPPATTWSGAVLSIQNDLRDEVDSGPDEAQSEPRTTPCSRATSGAGRAPVIW
ncbi:hypothetical protein ACFQRC_13230 [Enterovirga sp. GCM10030262]|uniref:hypothetical protein n=1 Tax=Enterovirga sp. GCM10030262 TaxID=3273391 RepID=UPI003615F378